VLGADGRATSESQTYERDNFWATTSNKQLNFLQHVKSLLKIGGTAAVVVPDNVLFEGGAGETVRRRLLREYDVHTLLRLPTGIFYAQGVKANVLFFERKPASETPWTRKLWIYDLRTNQRFTLKQNTLSAQALKDFVARYNAGDRRKREETERFRAFGYEELAGRDKANLDIFWLRDESLEGSEDLQPPDVIAAEIAENLEAALEQFGEIHADLRLSPGTSRRASPRRPCYLTGHVGITFAACRGPGEPRVGTGRGGHGPLPDVRARPSGRRRGDRGARPARCRGTGRDAHGVHRLAG